MTAPCVIWWLAVAALVMAVTGAARIPVTSRGEFAAAFRAACAAARWTDAQGRACQGLRQNQVAAMLEMSEPQLAQWLTDERPSDLRRFFQLRDHVEGRAFLRAFIPELALAFGLADLADGLRLADVFRSFIDAAQVRMAKASLREDAQRERA